MERVCCIPKVNVTLTRPTVIFLLLQSTVILNYLPTLQNGINNTLNLCQFSEQAQKLYANLINNKEDYPGRYMQGFL